MVVQLCQLMHCVSWTLLNKQRILDATRLSSTVWKLWLKSLFHHSDLILLITMRRCDNSVVVAQPREVYAMQLQKPDVTRTGSQKSCNETDCCSIMESINGGIYKVKACMLENGCVDGDNAVNVGGICVLCDLSFDHIWCSCSGCICQACQQGLVTQGIY